MSGPDLPEHIRGGGQPAARMERLESRRMFAVNATLLHGVGVLGDSFSDEYQFYPPDRSTSRNFVEMLARDRGINFGTFQTTSRGDARHQGYAFNWAENAATTSEVLAHQVPGLAAQVHGGQVTLVSYFAGGDDFLIAAQQVDPVAAIKAALTTAIANFKASCIAILAADPKVKMVVSTVPDLRLLPIVQQQLPFATPDEVRALGMVHQYNIVIRNFARARPRVALMDTSRLTEAIFSTKRITVGGELIDRGINGDDVHDLFLADKIHTGTVGQGLLARLFIRTINRVFNAGVQNFTDKQILLTT